MLPWHPVLIWRHGEEAATVLMATADLDYFETTPESPASAASDTSFRILFDTVTKHTRACKHTHLLAHICLHIELLGLYMPGPLYRQVASSPAEGSRDCIQPDKYHPPTTASQLSLCDCSNLFLDLMWLFFFFFCAGTRRHEATGAGRKEKIWFVAFWLLLFKKRSSSESTI